MIYNNLGRREQGKTTLALWLIRQARVRVVIDPRGLVPTTHRYTTAEDVAHGFDGVREAYATPNTLAGVPVTRLYDVPSLIVVTPDSNVQGVFNFVAEECKALVRDYPTRTLALLVDELRFIDTRASSAFDWLLRCSTRDMSVIAMTAHRPVDVPPDIRAITDFWCIFQTTQENDLKVLAERCSPDVAELAPKLKPREFLVWDDTRGTCKLHSDPTVWYQPLRAVADTGSADPSIEDVRSLDGSTPNSGPKLDRGLPFR